MTTREGATYLEQTGAQWRIRAARMEGFQLSYDKIGPGRPAGVRIDSLPGATLVVALSLRVIDAEHLLKRRDELSKRRNRGGDCDGIV